MAHVRRLMVVLLIGLALGAMVASPAQAQTERPGGPTVGDFIVDGEFDQESYLAAYVAFQTAPSIARGATVTLNVDACPAGETVTAEVLGQSGTRVSGSAPFSGTTVLQLAVPADTEFGFNRIRVICGDLLRDVVVNVVEQGSAEAVASLDIDMVETGGDGAGGDGAGGVAGTAGTLPRTGAGIRNLVGGGVAVLLLGSALVLGVRQRLQTLSA